MLRLLSVTASAALLFSACATATHTDLVDVVKRKATYELACDDVSVRELSTGQAMSNGFAATDQRSYGVDGCGKRASYQAWCTNMFGSESCDAVATTATPVPSAASSAQ